MPVVNVFNRSSGLDTVTDPKRQTNEELANGVRPIAACLNVDVDDTGQVKNRSGQVKLSSVSSHSLFCDGGDCFVVQDRGGDAAIYKVGTDFSLTGIRSGLTEFARISFCQVGNKTFYANGVQNGVIIEGISYSWPVDSYKGPDTLKDYTSAPIGTHIAYFLGRMWIAVDNVIYCSISFKPGLFRLAKYFFQFGTNIRMIRPVKNGVWISDSATTGFIAAAETWDGYKFIQKAKYPAHEWSDNQRLVNLSDSKWQIPGLSAVWSSDEGLCIGTEDGQLIVATKDKLIYPTGALGATVVDNGNVINNVY